MPVNQLIRKILAPFLIMGITRRHKNNVSMLKIKVARLYIQSVQKFRVLCAALMFGLSSLMLFASGLFLIHSALFVYSSWSSQTKFILSLILGTMEALGAILVLAFLFREETWVKFCAVDRILHSAIDRKGGDHAIKTDKKERA